MQKQLARELKTDKAATSCAIVECASVQTPTGWLDQPDRKLDLAERVEKLASPGRIDRATANEIERWIEALRPAVITPITRRFLHNDVHDMNLMCRRRGSLLAIIDWGDAGWGDPALELAQVPLAAVPFVLAGYESEAPELPGAQPEVRIIWDKLDYALHALPDDRRLIDDLVCFVRTAEDRWQRAIG